ncbi:hypothetical protein Moror_85 [Moniliophthora roreri MCA 2997]|uniref:Uncharacterized protein n=1 Tax=Moniliophthora roreri (strain MCA 2997) TaxID=1381753 RepID=V2Y0P8_MONRO|nr:hypothetical protein Moror_85 [Moniliophthora roreri MCA 2997]
MYASGDTTVDPEELDTFLPSPEQPNNHSGIADAIQIISEVTACQLSSDEERRQRVIEAAGQLILFLNAILALEKDALGSINQYAALVRPHFLRSLFCQRKYFRRMATQELLDGTEDSLKIILCWCDIVLAKVSDIAALLAGDLSQSSESSANSTFLRKQLEHDNLVATSHLPDTWHSIAAVLTDTHYSPAAKRLALRLLFSAFCVGPWLTGTDTWSDPDNISCIELLKSVEQYALQLSVTLGESWSNVLERDQQTFAMLLTLYAASDTECHHVRMDLPLRPRTMGALLDLLHVILEPQGNASANVVPWLSTPLESLDMPQALLLRWKSTVLWCWRTWNDSRLANVDGVVWLTVKWLYHCTDDGFTGEISTLGSIDPNRILSTDPATCCNAILLVLRDIILAVTQTHLPSLQKSSFYVLVARACKRMANLLRETHLTPNFQLSPVLIREVVQCLLSLFAVLHAENEEFITKIKYDALEALTFVDPSVITDALLPIAKDPKILLAEKVEEVMYRTRRSLNRKCFGERQSTDIIKINIEFISFVWHNTGRECLHPQSLAPFISALLDFLRDGEKHSGYSRLFPSIIMCLSVLDLHPSAVIKHGRSTEFWEACVRAPSSNLLIAGSFACYIVGAESLTNPLLCAQASNHLRGTLLLIVRGDFLEKERPFALLVSSLICAALIRLIQESPVTALYLTASPWSTNLLVGLKSLLQDNVQPGCYQWILKERLGPMVSQLLELTMHRQGQCSDTIAHPRFRLVMHKCNEERRLVAIPR